jgi:hypothetical protein
MGCEVTYVADEDLLVGLGRLRLEPRPSLVDLHPIPALTVRTIVVGVEVVAEVATAPCAHATPTTTEAHAAAEPAPETTATEPAPEAGTAESATESTAKSTTESTAEAAAESTSETARRVGETVLNGSDQLCTT